MAKTVLGIHVTFLTLLFAVLLLNDVMYTPVEKICERASGTWKGICIHSNDCNNQCVKWENAGSGSCHYQFPNYMCFCYFDC
uniref:Antimicrobial peptide D1 n=1 Tax=Stellaria media TaxID=13274 RepID=AMPD1_STEME|nr:RecName: Full=Antimicrobial peptide D1; Short=Sm-AMP-D1; Short=Sm-D1; Flags: Precursor [Stellaria media]